MSAPELVIDDAAPSAQGPDAISARAAAERRVQRLLEGVRNLRTGATLNLGEHTLMVLAGILAPLGLVLIVLGWFGAAHTPYGVEQTPYLLSGGMLGLGFVFLGSFCYFAHWITELVKEHRIQSAAVIEAIARLQESLPRPAEAATPASNGAVPLLATPKGTMAHRTDCVVVAGKSGLRPVRTADGLLPCKLCDPYAESLN